MKVFFTPEAEQQADYCDAWWRENRPASRDLFARELAEAKALVLNVPDIGSVYTMLEGQPVRRVLMKKTRHHFYYVVDADHDCITVHSVWGARKEQGPKL
jgi:plasmid stabilization system protein ParE